MQVNRRQMLSLSGLAALSPNAIRAQDTPDDLKSPPRTSFDDLTDDSVVITLKTTEIN